ncbi:MAG: helix-turn-helix transcriptional regulator [Alphaproteobacteria bacterium]|nr:helix-turn-helix transcriptional regulator [Alphaproteobacteria bacterium]
MAEFEIALRGATALQLLLNALTILRSRPRRLAHGLTALFSLGVVAYLGCSSDGLPWRHVLAPLCIANPFLFWLLALAYFREDFRFSPWHAVPLIVLEGTHFAGRLGAGTDLLGHFQPFVALALVLAAMAEALLGRRDDLLEGRRRLRLWFVLLTGILVLIITSVEIGLGFATPPDWMRLLAVASILLLALGFGLALTRPSRLLGPVPGVAIPAGLVLGLSGRERQLLERLRRTMEEDRLYRQEGLAIADLARRLGTQEHSLRRLINQAMGHRNFSEFLHGYRIAEAAARLADPRETRVPILTIALEAGYGSIGPFNRAFRAAMDETPGEYRRRRLAEARPEKSG